MDTIVRPPNTSSTSLATPRPRRRWRWVAIAATILILGGLTFGAIWIATYEPLEQGSFPAFAPPEPRLRTEQVDAFDVTGTIFHVRVNRGDTFTYRFAIQNDGPIAITIRRIGYPRAHQVGNVVTRFPSRVIPDVYLHDDRAGLPRFEPWHPFDLAPGQEAIVEMRATYERGCIDGWLGWNFEPVSFSVFGITRETNFLTDAEVQMIGTEECGSPG